MGGISERYVLKRLIPYDEALGTFGIPILLLFALALSGCLINERNEYALKINPDGKTGALTFKKYNIQSDASGAADRAKDFNDLMSNWKSDQMKQGAYVQERDVHFEDGDTRQRASPEERTDLQRTGT
jgi:hypothetical protein